MAEQPKLRLYNTLTRQKEDFTPLDAENIRMYVCGPTVYDFAHIGNARPVIVFDVLYRLLRHLYGEKHVTYVRNITDIDDKINKRAFERWTKKRPLLDEVKALTEGTAAQYEADVAALGCLPPTHSPRATDFVCDGALPMDMVRVIEKLVAKGHAYAAEGHVLFHVPSMPNYGKLSRRPLDEMVAGARVEVAPYKKDPMDFVLWKPSDPATEPGWDSPWGFGRPGWHIECSAMSGALLGEQFDIHAGGIDLIFPHHENEIAQTCCAFGVDKMASVWMHNGFLQVEGQKMSKSAGNFVTIREHLQGWGGQPWSGRALRWMMLQTHYASPIDWTLQRLQETKNEFRYIYMIAGIRNESNDYTFNFDQIVENPTPSPELIEALCDDLNLSIAIAEIRRRIKSNSMAETKIALLDLAFLGVLRAEDAVFVKSNTVLKNSSSLEANFHGRMSILHHNYIIAMSNKDLSLKDRIKNELLEFGISIKDDAIGRIEMEVLTHASANFDIKGLITARLVARAAKNFAESDRIRDELLAMGIQLKDGKDAITGEPTTTWEVKR